MRFLSHAQISGRLGLVAALVLLVAACSSPASGGNKNTTGSDATGGGSTKDTTGGGGGGITCGVEVGGKMLECKPEIELDEDSGAKAKTEYLIDPNGASVNFVIKNSGTGDLTINSVALAYEAQSPSEAGNPAFQCASADGAACGEATWGKLGPNGAAKFSFTVSFTKPADDKVRSAVLLIDNDSSSVGKRKFQVTFTTSSAVAKIKVEPETIDFGMTQAGQTPVSEASIASVGNGPLVITGMDVQLPADTFTLIFNGKEYAPGPLSFDPPVTIKEQTSIDLKVKFAPVISEPTGGHIILHTNSPSTTHQNKVGDKVVPVTANKAPICLKPTPALVAFGVTALGTTGERQVALKNCGDSEVIITAAALSKETSPDFAVNWAKTQGAPPAGPSEADPIKVPVNGSLNVVLTYTPNEENPADPTTGKPKPDTGKLVFKDNTFTGETIVQMEGIGSSGTCPQALIGVAEGDQVVPQTSLHLDGSQSFSNGAAIQAYQWEVDQPPGSVGTFQPNAKGPQVTFQVNVAGKYVFRLKVWDTNGAESCYPATREITVIPDQAIHVELLWDTPADDDQSNTGPDAGADMDLHFAHQYASGLDFDGDGTPDPWFDPVYDCFWFNKNPEWGSADPNKPDNPSLDLDDTDGGGPENLNLVLPEDGRTYSVGVHYFSAHGFGLSYPTVRIYIYGMLNFEVTLKTAKAGQKSGMNEGDMWYVATVDWPTGTINAKTGSSGSLFFTTPNYPHPDL